MIMDGTMRYVSGMILSGWLLLPSLSSCSSVAPRENFVNEMNAQVGMCVDSPQSFTARYREWRVSTRSLKNGHREETYRCCLNCTVFFEIDPKTRKIETWRFEGDERDCIISP